MSKIKVSIIVPVYNVEKYIARCIESIISQTIRELEIIIIDDGSLDGSGKIVDTFAEKDSRIKVIHQSNHGVSYSRNKGITEAAGDYIGFVDSDDWVEAEMFELLFQAASMSNADIAVSDYIEENLMSKEACTVKHSLTPLIPVIGNEVKNKILSTFAANSNLGYASLWNKIYKRTWLMKNSILLDITRDFGEDWLFNIDAFSKANTVIGIRGSSYHYILRNSNSLMTKYRANQFELYLDGRNKLLEKLNASNIDLKSYKEGLNKRFFFETISCVLSEIKTSKKLFEKWIRIRNILSNEEVIKSAAACGKMNWQMNFAAKMIAIKFPIVVFGTCLIRTMVR